MQRVFFLFVFLFTGAGFIYAQDDKAKMERERQEIQQELADLQRNYNQIKGQRSATLGQLSVLKRKIQVQERYLNNINREIRYLNDDIYSSTLEIIKMRKQLDTLKAQYFRSVVYAYKNRSNYDFLNFIFSASNFNDALKRIAYLKSYRSYREQQVNSIIETQQQIEKRKQLQISQMNEKKAAIQNQAKQVEVLQSQKKEKDVAVTELRSQEKELKKQIASKQKRDRDLKSAILAIVRREAKKAEEEAKAKAKARENVTTTDVGAANTNTRTTTATTKPKSYLDLNAEDVKLNASFESNRGKLPWPVDNGVVSIHFGPYEVEGTKLRGDNPGVTIATPSTGMAVKSVFNGEVAGVYNMGDGMAVTIRHGKYFTTYSNLTSVSVGKGTEVATGQSIGKVGQSDDGSGGQIDFILMIESKNVNPEPWLRRR
ncbi:MAG TPA: peptidoglycan DD-metalloendopeptidase family protein [Chitinophagaceae bacterium]|jgi:septal ring factor EnvC (AmiA/AmiB activator)|nr:peptidoglycan DD-metalloendopeptidase family protein [Chitinophagaceae bacterium]